MAKSCFVIMPFGQKTDPEGQIIDFDDIYEFMIRGAVEEDLKLTCVRCDKIAGPGIIHRDMIQQIFDADVCVVDITTTNANVFYELGVRHALRKAVTVVIRRRKTELPFNIRDLRMIDYDPSKIMSMVSARRAIKQAIEIGLKSGRNDSLVHEYIDVRVSPPAKPITESKATLFSIRGSPSKALGIITGDIQNVTIVDIWVNSENTNMQMARFYDSSISGVIRYLGAKKDEKGNVIDDVIANDLARIMGKDRSVDPGVVLATGAGDLSASHGVKRIFHAAVVQGAVGGGYTPVSRFQNAVRSCLEKADEDDPKNANCSSILFPLMATGTAKGDVEENVRKMVDVALSYLKAKKSSRVDRIYFLAWTEQELKSCLGVMERFEDLTRM